MGLSAVSAAVLSDQNSPFKRFTTTGLSITSALDKLITDSAAGATAISTGTKTNNGYICFSPDGKKLKTIFEEAEEKGMSTGVVVTCSVTNATPACFYSHVISRDYEVEIGKQLLQAGTDVVIGAGMKFFKDDWVKSKEKLISSGFGVYTNADSLLRSKSQQKLFALLGDEALLEASKRKYKLSDLVARALDALRQDKDGFILMIEGSQIDWGGHDNNTDYLLSELKDFSDAIESVLRFAADNKNTLVLVTADHETGGVSISGGDPDGKNLGLKFSTTKHTPVMVGVFAKGPGEQLFNGIQQNNEIGKKLFKLLHKTENSSH